jgi:anti-sigma factor RsiW
MSECRWQKRLSEYVVGALKRREGAEIERHLEHCNACRVEAEALRQTGLLLDSVMLEQAPEATWEAIRARIVRRSAPARARLRLAWGTAMAVVALVLVAFAVFAVWPGGGGGPVVVTAAEADEEMQATMEGHMATTWAAPLADEAALGLRLASMEDDG